MSFAFSDRALDTKSRALLRNGQLVPTEPQVFDLLELLARNAGRVVSRDEIIQAVWDGRIVSDAAISARIAAARKAVGDDGKAQRIIRTVSRKGLMFVAEVSEDSTRKASPGPSPEVQRIRYTTNASGRRVAFALTGEGPPVVRFNTIGTDLEAEWAASYERKRFGAVSASNTLLRFDFAGTGQSERSGVSTDFTVLAEDALAAADAAGFDRFAILAESAGTIPAVHFAAKYPDRVTRMVTVGGYVEGRARRLGPDAPEPLREMMIEGWSTPDGAIAQALIFAYLPEGPIEAVRDAARVLQTGTDTKDELLLRDAINWATIESLLSQVVCPTLAFHARNDAVHPLSEGQRLVAGIPDAELVVLETANHMPVPGQPIWNSFIETLLEFLAR